MIRVVLAEDQAMVRGAFAGLLDLEPDIEVIAEVAAGDLILSTAQELRPNVAVIDIDLPGMDGLTAAAELANLFNEQDRRATYQNAAAEIRDAFVGPYSAVGAEVRLEGAELEHSIVLDHAVIRHIGHRLEDSLVGSGATVTRDFAFLVPAALPAGDLLRAVRGADKASEDNERNSVLLRTAGGLLVVLAAPGGVRGVGGEGGGGRGGRGRGLASACAGPGVGTCRRGRPRMRPVSTAGPARSRRARSRGSASGSRTTGPPSSGCSVW